MTLPELPDWTQAVQLIGNYGGTPILIAVDDAGQLYALLKGYDGTQYVPLKVDANGNIVAVMKGEYAGTLKTLATDADGRLIAVLTDPEDVSGIFKQMGLAELASRLGYPGTHDRRGNVLWFSDFESGLGEFYPVTNGTGASVLLSTTTALRGAYSCKLTAGSDGLKVALVSKVLSYPILSKYGGEASFSWNTGIDNLQLDIALYDGTNLAFFAVRFDETNSRIDYLDSANVWQKIGDLPAWATATYLFHTAKLVVDLSAGKYERLIIDKDTYDLDAYAGRVTASATQPYIALTVTNLGPGTTNPVLYVDGMILTTNEEANP